MTDDKRPARPPRFNRDNADSRGESRIERFVLALPVAIEWQIEQLQSLS